MDGDARTIRLGAATVTVFNVGDSLVRLAPEMNVPESVWRPDYADIFDRARLFSSLSVHIALPGASVLVDPGDYALATPPGAPYRPPSYTPPAPLLEQLAAAGIAAASVTHVAITHAHYDHYSGVTVERDGRWTPAYPHARHFLGRGDWENPETQAALADPSSDDSRSLGMVHNASLLELVDDGDRELATGVRMLAAPGESPGHAVIRVESRGDALYCLGDLIHDPVEVEHPEWMPAWADAAANIASRRAVFAAALADNTLLLAAHIADVGRLERMPSGMRWRSVIHP